VKPAIIEAIGQKTEACVDVLPEDIEQVENLENDVHVAGGEEGGEVLHRVVQVPGEAVLYQHRCEAQHRQ